jgi:hypothetical protein
VLLWYQARGMRSQAVRGAAWVRPEEKELVLVVVVFGAGRSCLEEDRAGLTVCATVVEEDGCEV